MTMLVNCSCCNNELHLNLATLLADEKQRRDEQAPPSGYLCEKCENMLLG